MEPQKLTSHEDTAGTGGELNRKPRKMLTKEQIQAYAKWFIIWFGLMTCLKVWFPDFLF